MGQGLKTYPKEWSRALLLPRKPLYCQYASFPMWAEGHFCMHQAIWEINSLVSFHNLSSSSYPAVKPSLPPDPRNPHPCWTTTAAPSFFLFLPHSVPEQNWLCPIDWAGFQMILKLSVLPLHQNNKLSLQTLSRGWTWHIPLNAFWTSPVVAWQACRQHSQTRILVDSHLKAGVKLEREKGRGECSQLVLISVRFQLRFVKR